MSWVYISAKDRIDFDVTCGICGCAGGSCDCQEYADKWQFSPNLGKYGPRRREWEAENANGRLNVIAAATPATQGTK